jgi:hypothetical protein
MACGDDPATKEVLGLRPSRGGKDKSVGRGSPVRLRPLHPSGFALARLAPRVSATPGAWACPGSKTKQTGLRISRRLANASARA